MASYSYTKQQDFVRDVSRAVDMMDWPRALTVKPAEPCTNHVIGKSRDPWYKVVPLKFMHVLFNWLATREIHYFT